MTSTSFEKAEVMHATGRVLDREREIVLNRLWKRFKIGGEGLVFLSNQDPASYPIPLVKKTLIDPMLLYGPSKLVEVSPNLPPIPK